MATPRPIGPGARADGEANDASLADTAAAASLVAAARARRDARLGSKASAAAARVAELQAKEDARIAKMKAQLGL